MSEFVEYLHEIFEQFGPIRSRRMFGGFGIYRDSLMFALVANDQLYLKADVEVASYFARLQLPAFEYVKNGKTTRLSYYLAPAEILEDPEQAAIWARRSYEAALRANARKPKSRN
jgi:DNA transformation protein